LPALLQRAKQISSKQAKAIVAALAKGGALDKVCCKQRMQLVGTTHRACRLPGTT
jgi:hypothetical protein